MAVKKKLRKGFTTGACAAAGAKAAWMLLNGQTPPPDLDVLFKDGKRRGIKLESVGRHGAGVSAEVIKDAGDDPDVTDKACIWVSLEESGKSEMSLCDHVIEAGGSFFILRGGAGVGLVTRKGLAAPEGKWAINPGPLKMISDNLLDCGVVRDGVFLIEISVRDGDKIAEKTLNPVLGVVGGISILGTSGIVVPSSNKAYVETIRILLRGASDAGLSHVALCTGGSTSEAVRELYPGLPEIATIRIADFIGDSLKYAAARNFEKITVACMVGKLLKYAQGHKNTHAHIVSQSFPLLAKLARSLGADDSQAEALEDSRTVSEALSHVDAEMRGMLLDSLAGKALFNFREWTGSENIEIVVFSAGREALLRKTL